MVGRAMSLPASMPNTNFYRWLKLGLYKKQMKIRSKSEILLSRAFNKLCMFLPRYFKCKWGYKILEANSIINGRDSKNYKIIKRKLEFIHIPKTAGSSIKELFIDREWVDPDDNVHRPVSKYYPIEEIDYFTVLRNPVDRVWSFYQMALRFGPEYPLFRQASKGLEYFLRSGRKYHASDLQSRYCSLLPFKKPQSIEHTISCLTKFKGLFIFSNLEEDFEYLGLNLWHKNKRQKECPSKSEKSMIENINKVDSAVYDHFSKLTPHQRLFKLKEYILEKSGKHPGRFG